MFEIRDVTGRRIRLTKEGFKHIAHEHPDVKIEDIKGTLIKPDSIKPTQYNPNEIVHYHKYFKEIRFYLRVVVKYLNGEGFIITAHHMRNIK